VKKPTFKAEVGKKGEDLACQYLESKGFSIVSRNYRKPWGEIDIIGKKAKNLHFIEVKTVTRENLAGLKLGEGDQYRPEDNVHPWKLKRLSRTIQTYLLEKEIPEDRVWQFDVITVYLDPIKKQAKVSFIEDIVL